jgi:hypothetical protein
MFIWVMLATHSEFVIAGLDPAIHPRMDPRVKPAGDGVYLMTRRITPR